MPTIIELKYDYKLNIEHKSQSQSAANSKQTVQRRHE